MVACCIVQYILYGFCFWQDVMETPHAFSHATADVHPRFPTASPLRDRMLGEEITTTVWDEDRYGDWWRLL